MLSQGNCDPRKKLQLLETKKQGPNKGKLFYTCFDCDLFLWWDAARAREKGLTSPSAGTAAAEIPRPKTPSLTQAPLTAYGYQVTPGAEAGPGASLFTDSDSDSDPDPVLDNDGAVAEAGTDANLVAAAAAAAAPMDTPCPPSSKRKRDVFEDESDSDEFSDLESDEERQLAEMTDRSAQKLQARQQPRYGTPLNSSSTDALSGLPTPSVARTLFPGSGPESKRQKQVTFQDAAPTRAPVQVTTPAATTLNKSSSTITTTTTPATTPAPNPVPPPPSSPPNDSCDVTDEVLGLLRDQGLSPEVLRSVQSTLATAARRARGIVLGRDSARATVKARDDKIASLQERVAALENREKMHRNQVTSIKANLMKMYEDT
ncbi:hypothetical protein AK830_g8866 [Neonectria ditissima]|uniref:Zinc finger GRF-type domain-containing protein n=1 Tax=Neonectria ditissima TaxID=78410 RepID=A0A0N8H614_9HYPO|nr:hypothetical protein AK830_g8866 [Neonectria ditissima]